MSSEYTVSIIHAANISLYPAAVRSERSLKAILREESPVLPTSLRIRVNKGSALVTEQRIKCNGPLAVGRRKEKGMEVEKKGKEKKGKEKNPFQPIFYKTILFSSL